jgi:hypothetical protein
MHLCQKKKKKKKKKKNAVDDTLSTVLALIGKLGAATAFIAVYAVASDIFPPAIKATAVGSCSMASRIGGIAAPLMISLVSTSLAMAIFGGAALMSALLTMTTVRAHKARWAR